LAGDSGIVAQAADLIDPDCLAGFLRLYAHQIRVGAGLEQQAAPAPAAGQLVGRGLLAEEALSEQAGEGVLPETGTAAQQQRMRHPARTASLRQTGPDLALPGKQRVHDCNSSTIAVRA